MSGTLDETISSNQPLNHVTRRMSLTADISMKLTYSIKRNCIVCDIQPAHTRDFSHRTSIFNVAQKVFQLAFHHDAWNEKIRMGSRGKTHYFNVY